MSDSSAIAPAQKSNSTSGGSESNSAFADAVQRARQLAAKIHSTGSESSSVATGGVKRPLEDNMNGVADGSPEVKKMATNDPYGSSQVTSVQRNGADFVIEEYKVPDKMVGLIIGKGGEQILRLQAETGCKIQLAPDSGGAPDRPCTLTGNRDAVQKVKVMINQIIAKANSPFPPDSGHDGGGGGGGGGQYTAEMMIPGPKVGLLIGKGGENIKNLQEKGGVKMVLIQDGPQQTIHEKPLRISGDPQKVEFAKQMVIDLLAQKDLEVSRFANGAGAQEDFMVPRQAVGVVIGKSGEMIKRIQNDSGARVQFIQGKEDIPGDKLCQITGHPDQVQKAASMIQDLIQSVLMGGGVNDARGRGRGRGRGMGGPGMRPDFGPGGPRMRGPPDGPAAEIQYPVPANKCGLVIGKGGETVRGINQQSGAHVEIARGAQPNPHEKMFIIRGSPQQIEHAKQLINERIGMPPQGPPGGPPQGGPPNQFQPQYPQQFQQPGGPGQPYGAPNWGNPYQQWPAQPASAGVAVAPNDPTKVAAVDPNAAWAAYYAQFYGQPGQPQPGQVQPQPQPQPAAGAPPASQAPAPASTPGGQPDYSAAWAEYYRSLGMYREAEMIEQQARTNQAGQPTAPGAPAVGAPAMGPPNPAAAPAPQPGAPPQPVTPAGTPAPGAGAAPYPGVYSQPGQQPAPGQVAYGGGYPSYNYNPYGAQQQFAAPAPQ